MVEVMSSISISGFEEPWVQVSKEEVMRQQKFGSAYGVGRKVVGGKVLFTAKLPAASSGSGKTIKLGTFQSSDEASAAVQNALAHPEFQVESKAPVNKSPNLLATSNDVMEPSFCELVVPKKREYKDKIESKVKALKKKDKQRLSQIGEGMKFLESLEQEFEELRTIKSWARYTKVREVAILHLMQCFFPRSGDTDVESCKSGASEFCREALNAMWHCANDGGAKNAWSVNNVEDFLKTTNDDPARFGVWIEKQAYSLI